MELPSHPDAEDRSTPVRPQNKTSGGAILVLGILGAVVVLIIVLHLTGVVGPAAH